MAGQIDCLASLPEGPADGLLAKMLTPAPYKVPEKTKKAKGTRKSSQCPLSLLCITMILHVPRNFFEITTFPNSGIRAKFYA